MSKEDNAIMTGKVPVTSNVIASVTAQPMTNKITEYILCCPTLACELEAALQEANTMDTYHVIYLPDELHRDPAELKRYLQNTIDTLTDATRIVVLPSGCGGGTAGLVSRRGEINIPKTRDCLDILLSTDSLKNLHRPLNSIYLTKSWAEYMKRSSLDLETLAAQKGRGYAEEYSQRMYTGFTDFYIIDTGTYDTAPVEAYIRPLVNLLGGTLQYLKGEYGILKKVARRQFDDDFRKILPAD